MADISMLSTNFNIFSYATLIKVAMFIHSLMSRSDMSKLGAVLWGMILIGFAAWVTYKLQFFWLREAEKMTHSTTPSQRPVNPDDVALFESRLNFLIWLLPFVTASLGTNVLSDALLRGYTYQG